MTLNRLLPLVFCALFFYSCQEKSPAQPTIEDNQVGIPLPANFEPTRGETVYVPAYGRIFSHKKYKTVPLITTLAIHNTDSDNGLELKSVRYYSEDGTLLKEYTVKPRLLKPMATAIFKLYADNKTSSIGSNAVIEWMSETDIQKPLIEAIMVSTEGTQGISFVSQGYTIKRWKK